MPEVQGSEAEKVRNNRRLLIVALAIGLVLFGGWWSTRMLRARKSVWLANVRATGAKAGIAKKDYDDLGEIISEFTVGDQFIVFADDPRQIAAILEIPGYAPKYILFHIAYPAERQALKKIRERFPRSGVSHVPYLKWSDMAHASYADVR